MCPNRLGGMMQPAKAAHSAFLARRKLASGSSRAPCAFPNLRCCPRCWLFSCLGFEFPTPLISPKEHQKERCGHFRSQRSFITFSWCASEYSVVGRISCYVSHDNIGINVCQRSFAEFFLAAADSESNRFYPCFRESRDVVSADIPVC